MSDDALPKTAVNRQLAEGAAEGPDANEPAPSGRDEGASGTAVVARALDEGPAAPPVQEPARYAIPPISMSFSESELVRVGRSTATAPTNSLGLLVVRRSPQPVRLGQIVPLRQARHILGRGRGVACYLDDDLAAEFAAVVVHELTVNGSGYVLHVPAPGCALVNGAPTHRVTPLSSGDVITIGRNDLVFFQVTFQDASD
jgi:hypothetical protein